MKPIAIPKIRDQSAELAGLIDRAESFRLKLVETEKARAEFILVLSQRGVLGPEEPTSPAAKRIAELLGEAPPPIIPEHHTRLAAFAEAIRDLRSAHAIMAARVATEKAKTCADILARLAPEYRNRIRAICEALKSVHAANRDLRGLTDAMETENISWTGLGVVMPKVIGLPTDPYSPIGLYLADAREQGFIETSDIPEELRQ
jgi:hypothetical protein